MNLQSDSSLAIVILAAGLGTRMCSNLVKVLHPLAGKPLLAHVLDTARALNPHHLLVVVGHQWQTVKEALDAPDIQWVVQDSPRGTGHALSCALAHLPTTTGELLVLNGDVPLMDSQALTDLWQTHRQQGCGASLLTTLLDQPAGYGRVVRDSQGMVTRIVEEKDASTAQRAIQEVNTGTYCFSLGPLPQWLGNLRENNAQRELYLTDVIANCRQDGHPVGAATHPDTAACAGINSRAQLAQLEKEFRDRQVRLFMDKGVTFQDPSSCWLAADVAIGQDTVIMASVILGPGVVIGRGCHIGPFCQIQDSHIGDGCQVLAFSHLDGAQLAGPNTVGPFVRLRPASQLAPGARVGNFCEIKKSTIGRDSKINHLSYIGDATIGAKVNVGAGTITCNYDGTHKHQTIIEDSVFIGSDSQLVAPVTIGTQAMIAAGTTVTGDVPAEALAISRVAQRHIPQWHKRRCASES